MSEVNVNESILDAMLRKNNEMQETIKRQKAALDAVRVASGNMLTDYPEFRPSILVFSGYIDRALALAEVSEDG